MGVCFPRIEEVDLLIVSNSVALKFFPYWFGVWRSLYLGAVRALSEKALFPRAISCSGLSKFSESRQSACFLIPSCVLAALVYLVQTVVYFEFNRGKYSPTLVHWQQILLAWRKNQPAKRLNILRTTCVTLVSFLLVPIEVMLFTRTPEWHLESKFWFRFFSRCVLRW